MTQPDPSGSVPRNSRKDEPEMTDLSVSAEMAPIPPPDGQGGDDAVAPEAVDAGNRAAEARAGCAEPRTPKRRSQRQGESWLETVKTIIYAL